MKATRLTLVKRRAYKPLFEAAQRREHEQRDRALVAEKELARLRQVLAAHAEKETIPEITAYINTHPGCEEVALYPLSYEAMCAFLRSQSRWADMGIENYISNFLWMQRRLVCRS